MIARAKVRRKEINEKMSSFSQNPLEDISNNTTSSVKGILIKIETICFF